jgi:Ca-activated chloride channel family protein
MTSAAIPLEGCKSVGGRLVSTEGRELPLRAVEVEAEAGGGLARVMLRQTFANAAAEPLQVTYRFPLPADAAVSGYAFRIGARRVVGEVAPREAARERFEQAVLDGRSAALIEVERASLFTQEIGNVPPGEEVAVEIAIDQPLAWLAEGAWEWRFPTVAAPRYLGASGRVFDAERVEQEVADGPLAARASLALAIRDALAEGARPESPSHALALRADGCALTVSLAAESATLDRDLVVRWAVARPAAGLGVRCARPEVGRPPARCAYGLVTIVPPTDVAPDDRVPRDLVLLLDVSGSMGGRPLEHARRIAGALIDGLGDADTLEMIAFASRTARWERRPVRATPAARAAASRWLAGLRAGGGTEMRAGIEEALRPLGKESQRQVVLLTDGHIGFESEIVREVRDRLPPGSRLHSVGVGSSVNRSLTAPAARAGRGVEIVVDLDEQVERAAQRLFAATHAPVVVDLELAGDAIVGRAPRALPDLLAGRPVLVSLALEPEGGEVRVRGRTRAGIWEAVVRAPACAPGEGSAAIMARYARESVEDLEADRAAGGDPAPIDRAVERLGVEFQIATRRTSWVAVSEERSVDPQAPIRRVRMPQALPYGLSAEAIGLRPAAAQPMALSRAPDALVASGYRDLAEDRLAGAGDDEAATGAAPEARAPGRTGRASALRAREGRLWGRIWGRALGLGPRLRILHGRRIGKAAFETEIAERPLDWTPPAQAMLELADGRRLRVEIVRDRSTRAGRIGVGRSLRVTLALPDELGAELVAVELEELRIEL